MGDLPHLSEVFADPYALKFYPQMRDEENVRAWIEWNLQNYRDCGFGLWALELKSNGKFIGDAGLTYQTVEGTQMLEIGYHILSEERGQGFATEAASACLRYAFDTLNSETVCSIVDPANIASLSVAKRIHCSRKTIKGSKGESILFLTTRADWSKSNDHEPNE